MYTKLIAAALLLTGLPSITAATDYVVDVNGIVCEFCSFGVAKKIRKLPFIDKDRLNDGVDVDIENQKVTIAVKDGADLDEKALFAAIESGGYNPVRVRELAADDTAAEPQP